MFFYGILFRSHTHTAGTRDINSFVPLLLGIQGVDSAEPLQAILRLAAVSFVYPHVYVSTLLSICYKFTEFY